MRCSTKESNLNHTDEWFPIAERKLVFHKKKFLITTGSLGREFYRLIGLKNIQNSRGIALMLATENALMRKDERKMTGEHESKTESELEKHP